VREQSLPWTRTNVQDKVEARRMLLCMYGLGLKVQCRFRFNVGYMCVHEVEARQHARTRARARAHTHTHTHTHTCFTPALAGTRATPRTRRGPGVAAAEAHCPWPPPNPCWRAATLQAAMSQCPCLETSSFFR